jgi:putative membrane protein
MMGGYGGYGMGWFGGIFMIAFWVLVIAGIILFIRWLLASSRKAEGRTGDDSPLEILKKRYARGEINKEEFERMKKDLL